MARGNLRIYLGAAPGVGKTYAMLDEGWRRRERGTDVVVGVVETHNRVHTQAQLRDLEIVPRRDVEYRGTVLREMDVDAILSRRPDVALVDELAHTNVPGSRHEKRWQDVERLLDAGIDVISTVNIQHLESLNDVVARITGVTQRETVPDAFVRGADQIELVDSTPEALRRRMAHGNIYPAERIDAALANYFRPGNLGALRELSLLWVADRVEDSLQQYLADHGITEAWETRERVVVTVTGAPEGEDLIRRAARIAGRRRGELLGVRVIPADGLAGDGDERQIAAQRRLLTELGGTYHEVVGDDVARALADFAAGEKATQLVVGASPRSTVLRRDLVSKIIRSVDGADVHVIARAEPQQPVLARRPRLAAVPLRRQLAALGLLVAGLALLTPVLDAESDHLASTTVVLLYLSLVLAVAALGGFVVGVVGSVFAFLILNWYFTPPVHTFTIGDPENVLALVTFVAFAVLVSGLVDRAARRSREAQRARAEAEALARTTADLVTEDDPLPLLVDHLRVTFGLQAAAVLGREGDQWLVVAAAGSPIPTSPGDGTAFDLDSASGSGHHVLVLSGPPIAASGRRVLRTFAGQLTVALDARRLARDAAEADRLAEGDAVRTALLRAVSHDLRTPLAAMKAYVAGLREHDVRWSREQVDDALAAVDAEIDRLDGLVGNLLDAGRLQAGTLPVTVRTAAVEEIVGAALAGHGTVRVRVCTSPGLPLVSTDPVLLERALANIVANALRFNDDARGPVVVDAQRVADEVHVRVIDHGPGIPRAQLASVFVPFQRLGDGDTSVGVGLGLAIARGFIDAVGAAVDVDETAGGGVTVTVRVPVAALPPAP